MRMAAMILCGGASSRMGVDKGSLDWLGRRAVDLVAEIAAEVGAAHIVTVGGVDYGYEMVADEGRLRGPVGGVLAGSVALRNLGFARALVLAVDAPTLTAQDVQPLCDGSTAAAAFEGLHFPVMIELDKLPVDAEASWPMAQLLDRVGVRRLPCPPVARHRLRGANTPAERDALIAELGSRQNAQSARTT